MTNPTTAVTAMHNKMFLRRALEKNEPSFGVWLTFAGPALLTTLCSVKGYNWVLIDAEHGQITDSDYLAFCRIASSSGISPIIRTPSDESWMIKRALDSGAHGVMVPMCHNKEQAERIVRSCKLAPRGIRGWGSPHTHHVFGVTEAEYEAQCNDELLVIVQIESADGVKNVDEIASVPGVDVLFVGPFDLAKSMDVEFGGKEHEAAIAKVLAACKAANKKSAAFAVSGENARRRIQQGFDAAPVMEDAGGILSELERQMAAATK